MSVPKITLDQWAALAAVVEAGGYAKAAETLHKSQSSVTYAVQQLESLLGVKAFEIKGRKAVLTSSGQLLYRRARVLLDEATSLEKAAKSASAGWEAEIRIAAEMIFPAWLLLKCFDKLNAESPHTRIEYYETVIAGTSEALVGGRADLAITPVIPQGFSGAPLMPLRMLLVAHPGHPLHALGRPLTMRDLRAHRQLIVRETGLLRPTKAMVEATQRWTVSHMSTAIFAASMGFGYGWYPEERIRGELKSGTLKLLPLREGAERVGQFYLVYADAESAGPATQRLAEIIRDMVKTECSREKISADAETIS
ncbi:MAG TPA: LysR family transcriptional regulator [Burkholderiales bacterium]|nr:LysR family transcriptional regulator [Burkholderiales bacterium]